MNESDSPKAASQLMPQTEPLRIAPPIPEDLVHHLCNLSPLSTQEAERLVVEVLHYFGQTSDEFVRQRHQELQKSGLSNPEIYRTIEQELTTRVFRSAPSSIRQIRRAIYG